MNHAHIPLADLVAAADGELTPARAAEVRKHLESCWTCRARSRDIEESISHFIRAHQAAVRVPSPEAPRAMLRARLTELAAQPEPVWHEKAAAFFQSGERLAYSGAAIATIVVILLAVSMTRDSQQTSRLMPDPKLTPGAIIEVDSQQLCNGEERGPVVLPASVGRRVFDRYGIDRPKARAYELDQLISPELGGSEDPSNFWPQPYAASEWNAHLKDALEDRLHQLVCENRVRLSDAQQDIATNWIAAYKKYFETEEPIASHLAFTKDIPWEP